MIRENKEYKMKERSIEAVNYLHFTNKYKISKIIKILEEYLFIKIGNFSKDTFYYQKKTKKI